MVCAGTVRIGLVILVNVLPSSLPLGLSAMCVLSARLAGPIGAEILRDLARRGIVGSPRRTALASSMPALRSAFTLLLNEGLGLCCRASCDDEELAIGLSALAGLPLGASCSLCRSWRRMWFCEEKG